MEKCVALLAKVCSIEKQTRLFKLIYLTKKGYPSISLQFHLVAQPCSITASVHSFIVSDKAIGASCGFVVLLININAGLDPDFDS